MPFITYLSAEEAHVSGVIAVVVLGLGISRFSDKIFPDSLKHQYANFWEIIIFLLNGLIFILIGLQFPYIIREIPHNQVLPFVGYSFIIAFVALIIRMIRVFGQQVNLQKGFEKGRRRISQNALLDAKTSLIISWSGMRGIVSLAIAIGLPQTLEDGTPFPERNTIIFISIVVVLITLIGQGMSLPLLIKYLGAGEKETKIL